MLLADSGGDLWRTRGWVPRTVPTSTSTTRITARVAYFLIPTADRNIPPAAQRFMAERAGGVVVTVNDKA
jgi:hypothetical protein